MITLRIWLKHGTNIAALRWMGAYAERSRCGHMFIHVTHPQCSPLVHELPKEVVREVELHDYSVDELAIADGLRVRGDTLLYALSAEAEWLDGKMHLTQHVLARGSSIRVVMELYFIALQAKEVATYTRSP